MGATGGYHRRAWEGNGDQRPALSGCSYLWCCGGWVSAVGCSERRGRALFIGGGDGGSQLHRRALEVAHGDKEHQWEGEKRPGLTRPLWELEYKHMVLVEMGTGERVQCALGCVVPVLNAAAPASESCREGLRVMGQGWWRGVIVGGERCDGHALNRGSGAAQSALNAC